MTGLARSSWQNCKAVCSRQPQRRSPASCCHLLFHQSVKHQLSERKLFTGRRPFIPSHTCCGSLVLNVASQRNKKKDSAPFQLPGEEGKLKENIDHLATHRKHKNHSKKHNLENERVEVSASVYYYNTCKRDTFNWGKNTPGYIDEDFLSKATWKGRERGRAEMDQTCSGPKTKQGWLPY